MYIVVVGVNHRSAPVEIREILSFSGQQVMDRLVVLRGMPSIVEAAILTTCNRTEVYAAVTDMARGLASVHAFLSHHAGLDVFQLRNHTYSHTLSEAVSHLFQVVCGLDSMLLGETQVLGQVRDAYGLAAAAGACGVVFNTLFQKALAVGKRVRSETGLDQRAVSVSYAAVELVREHFGDLSGRTVLVVGAGKMSAMSTRYLVASGVEDVIVSNRSYDRAGQLAGQYRGKAVRFDELYRYLAQADIVISSTAAAHYVIRAAEVARITAGREREMLMADLAVPRDIEPAAGRLPGITLLDIDDVRNVVDRNLAQRRLQAAKAETVLAEEVDDFMRRQGSLSVVPTIAAMRRKADAIKEEELQKALNELGGLSKHDHRVVATLAGAITNRLLHDPVTRLKENALTPRGHLYTETLRNLFNLAVGDGGAERAGTGEGENQSGIAACTSSNRWSTCAQARPALRPHLTRTLCG